MRKLGFRVWDKEDESYLHITKNREDGVVGISPDGKKALYLEDGEVIILEDVIIEQDTGLKDKNGKMVYEGNIVEGTMGIFEVKWYDEISRFSFVPNTDMEWHPPFVCDQLKEMEVIGNIHENKELLGEKE